MPAASASADGAGSAGGSADPPATEVSGEAVSATTAVRLPRSFYERSPVAVAPELLNKVLVTALGSARIVEAEAYGGSDDPGSHGHRGPTPRTEVMFGPAGHLYVYFTYGMHWCANATVDADGTCGAVLLRAAVPLRGIDAMWARRPKARRLEDLCSGPAKLCAALGIDGSANGCDLASDRSRAARSGAGRAEPPVRIVDDGTPPPERPARSRRVGLSAGRGDDLVWRWAVPGSRFVSRPRPASAEPG